MRCDTVGVMPTVSHLSLPLLFPVASVCTAGGTVLWSTVLYTVLCLPGAPGALAHYPAVVWGSKVALEVAHSPPRPMEGETARGHGGKRPTARPPTVQVLWRDSVEHVLCVICVVQG